MDLLLINSNQENDFSALLNFFRKLRKKHGYSFTCFFANEKLLKLFRENDCSAKKIFAPASPKNNLLKTFFFLIFSPLFFLYVCCKFLLLKDYKKSSTLLLFGDTEKISHTIPAKIFKKKVLWMQAPDETDKNKLCSIALGFFSKFAKVICFNDSEKFNMIKNGVKEKNIRVSYFGIEAQDRSHQENIFSEIVEKEKANNLKSKFFTIGTISELDKTESVEILFQAIKKCISIIPNIQLIVVGDGKKRKNLSWIAKKIEINNLVWFVGEQKNTAKWIANFDIVVSIREKLSLHDIKVITEAMAAGKPLISHYRAGLEYMIDDSQNGILINTKNSEELSAQIIRLQQNQYLRENIKTNAKATIDNFFRLDTMVDDFHKIINEKI